MNGKTKRVGTSFLVAFVWSFGFELHAQEPVVSEDRFADTLRAMESRMAELEESNARMEAELSVYGRSGTSHLTGMSQETPGRQIPSKSCCSELSRLMRDWQR